MQTTYFSYALIASAISGLNISVVTGRNLKEAPAKGKPKSDWGVEKTRVSQT
jgi:hypothetical protein